MKLSLVIPTYNERENIKKLIPELSEEFKRNKIDGEIIVVDDNSPDGTGDVIEGLKKEYLNLSVIHREGKLGLSSAAIDGFRISKGEIVGLLDADLSHESKKIGEMYQLTLAGSDIVIGSRYVRGGKIEGWNWHRKLLSKVATLFARVFTDVKDPMSGFFLLKKDLLTGKDINSKGFKILLELLLKIDFKKITEVPIIFTDRVEGKSKAGVKEIFFYLRNLIGYLPYKKEIIWQFLKFAFVGFLGTLLNLFILFILTEYLKFYYIFSAVIAFIVAVTFNFVFNKIWTFQEKLNERVEKEYATFFLVSLVALSVSLFFLYSFTEIFGIYYILSQILAIGISLAINFIGNKIWTFPK